MPATQDQMNFRVDKDLKQRFIDRAREKGTSASELFVDYMKQYLGEAPIQTSGADVEALINERIDVRLAEFEQRMGERLGKAAA